MKTVLIPALSILVALSLSAQESAPAAADDTAAAVAAAMAAAAAAAAAVAPSPPPAPASQEPPPAAADREPPVSKPVAKFKSIPSAWGDRTGPAYIGHRFATERYAGWGWVWPEKENSSKGRWVIVQETPGRCPIPSRLGGDLKGDSNYEYRLYGEFLTDLGYDPNYDWYVEVFRLKGFELIGPAEPLLLKPTAVVTSPAKKRSSTLTTRGRRMDLD